MHSIEMARNAFWRRVDDVEDPPGATAVIGDDVAQGFRPITCRSSRVHSTASHVRHSPGCRPFPPPSDESGARHPAHTSSTVLELARKRVWRAGTVGKYTCVSTPACSKHMQEAQCVPIAIAGHVFAIGFLESLDQGTRTKMT